MWQGDKIDTRRKVELEFIIDQCIRTLQTTYNNVSELYESMYETSDIDEYTDLNEFIAYNGKVLSGLCIDLEDKLRFLDSFNHEYLEPIKIERDNYKNKYISILQYSNDLKNQNSILIEQVDKLSEHNKKLMRDVQDISSNNEDVINHIAVMLEQNKIDISQVNNIRNMITNFLEEIDDSVNNIALNKFIRSDEFKKRDMKDDKHPHYRQDVNNEELINDYLNGLTVAELVEKYKMTQPGIAYRLKKAGVYKTKKGDQ